MTAAAERFTLDEARDILLRPTTDDRYHRTALGPDIEAYLAWKRLSNASETTLDGYEHYLAQLAVDVPSGTTVADVNVEHLMLTLNKVPRGSWKKVRAAWNGFFKWSIRHGRRGAINPVELLPPMLKQGIVPVYDIFSAAEQQAIVNATRMMDTPAVDRVRAHLLLDAGLRRGGALGLLVKDVDPTSRCIIVKEKGDKQRIISIRGDFWRAWEEFLLTEIPAAVEVGKRNREPRPPRPLDHVWFPCRVAGAYGSRARTVTATYPEQPLSPRGWSEWWKRLLAHADVPYRKPHMARHTFATDALDASDDLYGVSQILGHSSTRITEAYVHSSRKHVESVAEKLDRARRDTLGE